jgi:S1-C subfamily serine protease
MKKTLYEVLGVSPQASAGEIESRYREIVERLRSVPASPDADNEGKIAKYAFEILGDAPRRADYDRALLAPASAPATQTDEQRPLWPQAVLLVALVACVVIGYKVVHKAPQAPKVVAMNVVSTPTAPVVIEPVRTAPVAGPAISAADIFKRNAPSTVMIVGLAADGRPLIRGSGVVIDRGEVLTNCHVALAAPDLQVKFGDRMLSAGVRYSDQGHDLCQLSVRGLDAQAVAIGDVAAVSVGDEVYALGAPQGLELSLSGGLVSSLRSFDDAKIIQTTAAISPGSSGGGLFDRQGKLIGITTFQARTGQNLNFAIPASWIAALASRNGNKDKFIDMGDRPPVTARGSDVSNDTAVAVGEVAAKLIGHWDCVGRVTERGQAHATYEFTPEGSFVFAATGPDNRGTNITGRYRAVSDGLLILSSADLQPHDSPVRIMELGGRRLVLEHSQGERVSHFCSR